MANRVDSLEDLLDLMIANPSMARHLHENPQQVASLFNITLSKQEQDSISRKLDVEAIVRSAVTPHSMVMKVAQGLGLEEQLKAPRSKPESAS
jgi:hypothetical protein